jgi:hypothetical protein
LQAGWSDSTFAAEWVKQQQEEEAWAGDDLTVVEADDRWLGAHGGGRPFFTYDKKDEL